jgi:hypothetical protein
MRIAIVSDIHGNLTALEAVLHRGDLAHGGAKPVQVIDRIRELAWPEVSGNADERLWRPESLSGFAAERPQLQTVFQGIAEVASRERELLGADRLAWLQ